MTGHAGGEVMDDLCAWLRANSSGIYRKSADAADVIEQLRADLAESQAREAKLRDALRNITFADEVRVLLRDMPTDATALREMIEAAKAEEREACAKMFETDEMYDHMYEMFDAADRAAAAIRERKT